MLIFDLLYNMLGETTGPTLFQMKLSVAFTLLCSAAYAVAELSLPTIVSTSVCTLDCSASPAVLAPSSFKFSNLTTTRAAAAVPTSTKGRSTIYDYDTATDNQVFDRTRTICDENSSCYVTTDLESSTTMTTTVGGVLTVITTAVPVSDVHNNSTTTHADAETTQDAESIYDPELTTTSTITSTICPPGEPCHKTTVQPETSDATHTVAETIHVIHTVCPAEKPCYLTEEPQVLSTYTTTIDDTKTVVTTYCPLSGETSATAVPETDYHTTLVTITSCQHNRCSVATHTTGVTVVTETVGEEVTAYTTYCPVKDTETSTPKAPATSAAPTKGVPQKFTTVNVITDNIVTELVTTAQLSISSAPPVAVVSSYEAAANVVTIGSTFVGLLSMVFLVL